MEYKEKYLKYKSKYLDLKSKIGGIKLPNFLKSKQQLAKEAEEKRLLLEQIENERLARLERYRLEEEAQKKRFEEARIQRENKEKLIRAYEELGYKYNEYKRDRINIPTELDNEHLKFSGTKEFVLPPNVKSLIFNKDWETYIVGLKDKFVIFKNKFYNPLTRLGYLYSPPIAESYDYNRGQTIPSTPAAFYLQLATTKFPHSEKIYIANRFYDTPPLPSLETWPEESRPNVSPGKGWKRISASEPEWDPQNQHFFMTEKWENTIQDNMKQVIYESDWESELAKLNR
jgi:hypothetical protein